MSESGPSRWTRRQLTYCSNVHPGITLEQLFNVIEQHFSAVRSLRGLPSMGSGLWLSSAVARRLREDASAFRQFQLLLQQQGLHLFTLNGFPYGDFHQERVKEKVYQPDWSNPERYRYTLDLARILADAMPPDQLEGTISTLPLGYRPGWSEARQERALINLCRIADELNRLKQQQGRSIRICLEMEPGCVLEGTEQITELFTVGLPAAAERLGIPLQHLSNHLGVCYDICHQAVMFEDPAASLERLEGAGITVGKIQISSALELADPLANDPQQLLQPFAEPRYLHQVRVRTEQGLVEAADDLPAALGREGLSRNGPWRIHFHVPVQAEMLSNGALRTTRTAILGLLDYLQSNPSLHPHLEVETYTWQVLPPESRPDSDTQLHSGLATELGWLEAEMGQRGLLSDYLP